MRLTWVLGLAAVSACALWAFFRQSEPVGPFLGARSPDAGALTAQTDTADPFDDRHFSAVKLWNPVAKAKPTPDLNPENTRTPATTEKVRLQLIGITKEGEKLYAALYDPDQDRLLIVADGDQIQSERVTKVTLSGVTLSDGQAERELKIAKGDR